MITTTSPPTESRPPPNKPVTPQRDYLSYSALSCYQRCPLQYWFRYVQRRPPEFVPVSLHFGSAIHAALERHFRLRWTEDRIPSQAELLRAYQQAWDREDPARLRYGKGETAAGLHAKATHMLAAFREHPFARLRAQPLAIEEELRGRVLPEAPPLLGRVDLVLAEGRTLRIVDFKTSRSRWQASDVEYAAPQLLLYAELARPLAQALNLSRIQLEWLVLTKTQVSQVTHHEVLPQPGQFRRLRLVLQRVWQAIRQGCVYPVATPQNCYGCTYQQACQGWEG